MNIKGCAVLNAYNIQQTPLICQNYDKEGAQKTVFKNRDLRKPTRHTTYNTNIM